MIAAQTIGILDVIPTVNAIVDSGWEVANYGEVICDMYDAKKKLSQATNVIVYYQKGYDNTPWFFAFPK